MIGYSYVISKDSPLEVWEIKHSSFIALMIMYLPRGACLDIRFSRAIYLVLPEVDQSETQTLYGTSKRNRWQIQTTQDVIREYADKEQDHISIRCVIITPYLTDLLSSVAQFAIQRTVPLTPFVDVDVHAYVLSQYLNQVIDCILLYWQALHLQDQPW